MAWLGSRNHLFNFARDHLAPLELRSAGSATGIKLLLAYPLMPVKLLMDIHWEALLLRLKGMFPRPKLCTLPGAHRPASRWLDVAAQ